MSKRLCGALLVGILVISLAGCNLPQSQPTAVVNPTPNMTMTALFAPGKSSATTPTVPAPQVITATKAAGAATTAPGKTATVEATKAATSAVTATKTVTAAAATKRSSGDPVVATFLSTAPVIDGNLDDWKTTEYTAKNVVWGGNNWTGTADLSSTFRIGWDATNLYIAAKVTDDTYVQKASGQYIFKGDSIELVLDKDLSGDFSTHSLNTDDYQLGLNPGYTDTAGKKEAYLWFPKADAGLRPQVSIAANSGSGYYNVEASIPWTVFGLSGGPTEGKHYGFAFSLSDDDSAGTTLQQSMVSNVPTRVLADPTTWGDITFTK